jgi:hypothetical protein
VWSKCQLRTEEWSLYIFNSIPPQVCLTSSRNRNMASSSLDHKTVAQTVDHDDVAKGGIVRGGLAANMTPEKRAQVEKTLKRKLDARCSLFVLIYIMNYLDRYVYALYSQKRGREEETLKKDDC